jgi:hypothetical protein
MRRFQHLRKDFSASAPSISRQSSYKNDNVIPPENDDEPVVPESPERKLLRQLTRRLSIDLNEMDGDGESTLEDGQRSKRFCEMMMGDFESSMNERDKILHALQDSLVTKDIGNPTNFEDELAEMLAEQAAVDDDDDEGIFDVVATEPHAAEDLNLDQKGPTIDPQAVDTMEADRKNQEIEALEEELRQAREECRLAHQQVMSVEMSYQSEQRRNEALEREIRKLRQELTSAKEAAQQQSSQQLQQQEAAAAAERERQQQDEALQRSASARELANQQNDALAAALAELAKTKERLAQETLANQQAEARHAADRAERAAREEATIKASQAAEAEARKQQAVKGREGQSIPRQLKHVGVETNASERAALEAMASLQQQLDQLKKRAAELGVLQQQIASMEVVITQLSNLIRAMMKARYLVTYDERDLKIESQSPATIPSSPPLQHLSSSHARTPRRVASASPAHMKSAMAAMKTPPSPTNRGKPDSLRDTLASMQRLCLENW